jgi:hypothetical protein
MGVGSEWSCQADVCEVKWVGVFEILGDNYYFAEDVGCYIHNTEYSGGSQ